MTCEICKRRLRDGDSVVVIQRVVANEKRGDFVTATDKYIHVHHLTTKSEAGR